MEKQINCHCGKPIKDSDYSLRDVRIYKINKPENEYLLDELKKQDFFALFFDMMEAGIVKPINRHNEIRKSKLCSNCVELCREYLHYPKDDNDVEYNFIILPSIDV